jgi:predicted ATP-grasp superfamily ATP-dependent carboligase
MIKVLFGTHRSFIAEVEAYIDKNRFEPYYSLSESSNFSDYDCVVPFHISDYDFLDASGPMYRQKYYIPSKEIIDLCDDKLKFNRQVTEAGFSENIPAILDKTDHPFPYILKRRRDENGHNSSIVENRQDEAELHDKLWSEDFFCQTCITGSDEYAAHILMVDGVVHYHKTVHHVMGIDLFVKGGGETTAKSISQHYLDDMPFLEEFASVLRAIGYNGLCCIDYKVADGVPKILEVNPRIGFTVIQDINNFLEAYVGAIRQHAGA